MENKRCQIILYVMEMESNKIEWWTHTQAFSDNGVRVVVSSLMAVERVVVHEFSVDAITTPSRSSSSPSAMRWWADGAWRRSDGGISDWRRSYGAAHRPVGCQSVERIRILQGSVESFEVLEEVFHDLRRRVHAHVETHELEDEHPVRPQIRVHESLGKGEEEVIELR